MLKKYTSYELLLISLLAALFVLYIDLTWLPFELKELDRTQWMKPVGVFVVRYAFFACLIFTLVKVNLQNLSFSSFKKRVAYSSLITIAFFAVYGGISFLIFRKVRHYGSLVLFQCFIIAVLSILTGHIISLYTEQRKKEQEIEELTIKNLQSRYDALTNQINPHFFFNSLNGLTSLIRKRDEEMTLTYVNMLSDVFRYILQSDKKGLITLSEELDFVDAFRYMMEVRFANKLSFTIEIGPDRLNYKLPVLSILPLLDNIVVHNRIDSDHKMVVNLYINDKQELVVTNPLYPKLAAPVTNGTGLKNLESRYLLLVGKPVRAESDGKLYTVYLPLS